MKTLNSKEQQLQRNVNIRQDRLNMHKIFLYQVLWMNNGRLPKQVLHREVNTNSKGREHRDGNWTDSIRQDLKETGMSWEEVQCCIDRED